MTAMGETSAPAVSVIVPHFDQPGALALCLQSLAHQTFPRGDFEVIVADNSSRDQKALEAALRQFPPARLVREEKRGAAHARNSAIRVARGRVFAFIDADCVADPAWLSEGVKSFAAADLSGGEVIVTVKDEFHPAPVEAFERVFAFRQRDYVARKGFSVTANLFVTREALERTGDFVHGVSEDVDFCRRAAALGFRLAFNASSIIGHPARRDWSELVRKWERLVEERWNGFGGRSPAGRLKWAALAIATALSAAPHMFRVLTTRRLRRFVDRAAAAGVLVRIRWWRARRMFAVMRAG
jgi:glycosyltransferase involved in cell wall biosynthesis